MSELLQLHLNRELKPILEEMAQKSGVPLWVELLPAGETIEGRDGRSWRNSNPQAIVDAFDAHGADLPIDIEHATELKGPNGDAAPAVAWVKALEVREGGAIWGLVDWNGEGEWLIESKQYRYLSPVFIYSGKSQQILRLTSAGLTNNPNLHLTALNRRDSDEPGETPMKELLKALGLSETATEATALNAVQKLKDDLQTSQDESVALNQNLKSFVPRADYDTAINRAETAETSLTEVNKKALNAEIDTAIDGALKSGVITPATAEYHRATCQQEGGLERFKDFAKSAPKVGDDSNLDDSQIEANAQQLTEEDKAVCAQLGMPEADYLEHKKSLSA